MSHPLLISLTEPSKQIAVIIWRHKDLHVLHFCMYPKSICLTSFPWWYSCTPIFYRLPKIFISFLPLLLTKVFKYFTFLQPLQNLYTLPLLPSTKAPVYLNFLWLPQNLYILPMLSLSLFQPILSTYDSLTNQLSNYINTSYNLLQEHSHHTFSTTSISCNSLNSYHLLLVISPFFSNTF